jgi:hypothetical protein
MHFEQIIFNFFYSTILTAAMHRRCKAVGLGKGQVYGGEQI